MGTLVGLNDGGRAHGRFIRLIRSGQISLARTTVAVTADQVGREVVLVFEGAIAGKPIMLGFMVRPGEPGLPPRRQRSSSVSRPIVEATLDGEQLVLTAEHELVLRCGKASLTLTRAGKILLRGTYLLSRSSGVNRIKGGSVQIN